jgi:hypothetical protein
MGHARVSLALKLCWRNAAHLSSSWQEWDTLLSFALIRDAYSLTAQHGGHDAVRDVLDPMLRDIAHGHRAREIFTTSRGGVGKYTAISKERTTIRSRSPGAVHSARSGSERNQAMCRNRAPRHRCSPDGRTLRPMPEHLP